MRRQDPVSRSSAAPARADSARPRRGPTAGRCASAVSNIVPRPGVLAETRTEREHIGALDRSVEFFALRDAATHELRARAGDRGDVVADASRQYTSPRRRAAPPRRPCAPRPPCRSAADEQHAALLTFVRACAGAAAATAAIAASSMTYEPRRRACASACGGNSRPSNMTMPDAVRRPRRDRSPASARETSAFARRAPRRRVGAGVGVEPAGNVEREHRRVAAR